MGTEESVDRPNVPDPPPPQPGPHFAIVDGLLDVVRHPSSGLNLSRLEKLVPALREAVAEARELLRRSNSHARLARRLALYDALLAGEISDLDYELVATFGIQLANAEAAAQREIEDRIQPALEDDAQAALADVLNLNALVVLSTDVGQQILDDAAKWDRSVAQQRAFKIAAIEIAESIEQSGIATTSATDLLTQSSTDIGTGPQPERSSVMGQRVIMSAALALVAGAVAGAMPLLVGPLGWIATVVIGEGIKKSDVGQAASRAITETISDPSRLKQLGDIGKVVQVLAPKFRIIAGDRREFRWVHEWLDFVLGGASAKSEALSREEKIFAWFDQQFPNSLVLQEGGVWDYLITDQSGAPISGVSFIEEGVITKDADLRRYTRAIESGDVPTGIVCIVASQSGDALPNPVAFSTKGDGTPIGIIEGFFSRSEFAVLSKTVVWIDLLLSERCIVVETGPLHEDSTMSTTYVGFEGLILEKLNGDKVLNLVAARKGQYVVGDVVELEYDTRSPAIGPLFFAGADGKSYDSDAPNRIFIGVRTRNIGNVRAKR